jgi:hypothetical protein
MNHLYYAYKSLFFSLERKEPKVPSGRRTGQDCQKKSENSTVRVTEILKLTRTQGFLRIKIFLMLLSARSNPSGWPVLQSQSAEYRRTGSQNFYVTLTGIFTDFF